MTSVPASSNHPGVRPSKMASGECAVVERLCHLFRNCHLSALKDLPFEYHQGVVTLVGSVPTYYMKQVAQALLGKAVGMERVIDKLVVKGPGRADKPKFPQK